MQIFIIIIIIIIKFYTLNAIFYHELKFDSGLRIIKISTVKKYLNFLSHEVSFIFNKIQIYFDR